MHFLQKYKVVFPHSAHRPCFALPVQELNMSDFTLSETLVSFLEPGNKAIWVVFL